MASDLIGLVLALVAATVTARALGPAGKGYYSSVLLLSGLALQVFSAGLGEAAIVLVGNGKASLQQASSATIAAVLPLSVTGAAFLYLVASILLPNKSAGRGMLLLASAMVAVNVLYNTGASFLVAKESVVHVAAIAVLSTGVSTALLWLLVMPLGLGTAGAILAGLLGSLVAVAATFLLLVRAGLSVRPRVARTYLRAAAGFGFALQFSNLLVQLTARLDLVLVYRLSAAADAGEYSIALTIGALVGSVPLALAYAAFPRLALLGETEARLLTAQVFRMGITAALLVAAVLAAATPLAVPLVFGHAYVRAIAPTLLLIPAGVLWSGQWLLCRAAAARGIPRPLLVSFAVSFVTMIGLDLVLIRPLGGVGAGLAAVAASGLGLLIAVDHYRRHAWDARAFRPRHDDLQALREYIKGLVSTMRGFRPGRRKEATPALSSEPLGPRQSGPELPEPTSRPPQTDNK